MAFNRASFFLRLYCLPMEECPNISMTRHSFNQVCTGDPRGARVKGDKFVEEMQRFWNDMFSGIYPDSGQFKNGAGKLSFVLLFQLASNIKPSFMWTLRTSTTMNPSTDWCGFPWVKSAKDGHEHSEINTRPAAGGQRSSGRQNSHGIQDCKGGDKSSQEKER